MSEHSDIDSAWLRARVPLDNAARDARLEAAAWATFPDGGHVLDFGGGTGSAALTYRSRSWAQWTVLERNAALASETTLDARMVRWVHAEFPDAASYAAFAGADLVHASAVLDMLTALQLTALIHTVRRSGVPLYAPLNIVRSVVVGGSEEDVERMASYDAHMSRHHKLGGALGPMWHEVWHRECDGLDAEHARSVWRIGPETGDAMGFMLRFLRSVHHDDAGRAWCERFGRRLCDGSVRLEVQHEDVLLR